MSAVRSGKGLLFCEGATRENMFGSQKTSAEAAALVEIRQAVCEQRPLSSVEAIPHVLTAAMASEILGISQLAVMEYVADGRISVSRLGEHSRLLASDVVTLREERVEQAVQAVFDLMDLERELEAQEAAFGN
ncbi:hypothetical protein [Corynebacterium sp. 22KM0430]|uniref:hypothetical protein n=2 Tax=unclassified Corynebacterium TaxID=2624378 RepID=UPI0029C9DA31|nr:hypothetical protein [Corynebacterium sp. 22KM0430]WPF65648.1 hypothetical protein OLX12_08730 [Corynebacterium sp. 22KM0430]